MKPWLQIIGDVHGRHQLFCKAAKKSEYSVCVGDVGFEYSYLEKHLDPSRHVCVSGNHDNYTRKICEACEGDNCAHCDGKGYVYCHQSKHFLKDYGIHQIPDFEPIFYVRGAWSIDQKYRVPGVSWWEDEEIPYQRMLKALEMYKEVKPDFMVTHTVPFSIMPTVPFERLFGNELHKPRTETLLDEMYEFHQPKTWLFGHFHVDWDRVMIHPQTGKGTRFICLDELSCKEFPKIGEEVNGNR